MTEADRTLLKASIDKVVALTLVDGERPVRVMFVFDEGETPDVFFVEVTRGADGEWVEKKGGGRSELLTDVVAVRRLVREG